MGCRGTRSRSGGRGETWRLERARGLRARGKMLRAYGALPADSVRPEIPGEPEPVGSGKTERSRAIGPPTQPATPIRQHPFAINRSFDQPTWSINHSPITDPIGQQNARTAERSRRCSKEMSRSLAAERCGTDSCEHGCGESGACLDEMIGSCVMRNLRGFKSER